MIIILTARWCYFRHYQPAYPYPALFHVIHHLKYSAHVILILMRQHHSIKASDTAYMANTATAPSDNAVNAFQEDLTLFRAIERLDCVLRDDMAYYKALYDPASGTTGTGNAG